MRPMSTNNALINSSAKPLTARPPSSIAPEPAVRVALVDDDELFRESLGLNLGDEGFEVVSFERGQPALEWFRQGGTVDIVLLDWRMPKMDGLEVLREMRSAGIDTPVIFLTVLSDQIYEEAALAGGAVDFVEKSRSLPILLKRIQIILDGRKGDVVADPVERETGTVRFGELELRLDGSRAFWKGVRVDLTLTEFNIVRVLSGKAGQDVSYRDIYDLVHGKGFMAGYGPAGYRANVRAFIKRIRQKFRAVDDGFDMIFNYPGFGYRWSDGTDVPVPAGAEED
ncbi:response regulator transcription factor [Arenibaculum pallidiluteum]|uniref:response regulator transcription factor n=1 Tax=Arenibaculum pallidiluteum TaxID=2812559 RepID=UPI001A970548|nr:response regulator transcription factor [Arenibaculum pallidiluteum]